MRRVAAFENAHILLWLIKDLCWLFEWKLPGTVMIVPTVGVAVYLTIRTAREPAFWINLAITCWITANAYWMMCEFVEHEEIRMWAAVPFLLGLGSVGVFYWSNGRITENRPNRPNRPNPPNPLSHRDVSSEPDVL